MVEEQPSFAAIDIVETATIPTRRLCFGRTTARLRPGYIPASQDLANAQVLFVFQDEAHVRKHQDGNAHENLDDAELIDREERDKRELIRLEGAEPGRRESTPQLSKASAALLQAWERWKASNIAARLRGLRPKESDLR